MSPEKIDRISVFGMPKIEFPSRFVVLRQGTTAEN